MSFGLWGQQKQRYLFIFSLDTIGQLCYPIGDKDGGGVCAWEKASLKFLVHLWTPGDTPQDTRAL